jgi:hypothetical protein
MRLSFVRLLLMLASLLSAVLSNADRASAAKLDEPVPNLVDVSFLDLVRQLVPDLSSNGTAYEGHRLIDMPDIAGPSHTIPPDKISLSDVVALNVASDGKERLLLLIDVGRQAESGEGFAVLALYDLAGKLLDAANVAFDRHTSFRDPARLSLGDGKDAMIITSSHFNSSQAYVTTALILIRNDQLELIDDILTFDELFCSFTRTQVPSFRAVDRGGRTYSGIEATVVETTTLTGQSCEGEETPAPEKRAIFTTYQWSGTRFVPDSDALDRLAEENRTRF